MQRLRDLESQVADYMEPELKAEIGARLKHARENSPYGQKEFADAAGVGLRTYQFWEQGRGVNRAGVDRIAKKCGIDGTWVWEGDGDRAEQLDRIEQKLDAIQSQLRGLTAEQLLATLETALDQRAGSQADTRERGRRARGQ